MDTIKFNGEEFFLPYADLLPPLTEAEFLALEANILAEGKITYPIVLSAGRRVIDGANRLRIAVKNKLPASAVDFVTYPDLTAEQERDKAFDLNIHRRQLDREQMADVRLQRVKRVAEATKAGESQRSIAKKESVHRVTVQRDQEEAAKLGMLPTKGGAPSANGKPKPAGKAKSKPKPKPSPTPTVDAAGQAIPGHLQDLYGNTKLQLWAGDVERLIKDTHAAVTSNWAYHLSPDITEQLADVLQTLKDAIPYAVCPECKGAGCKDNGGDDENRISLCKTSGLVPEHIWIDWNHKHPKKAGKK